MRICIVVPYDLAEEGGVKRHAVQLAASLRGLGDEVDVLGPYSGKSPLPEHIYGLRGVVNIRANGSDNRLGIFVSPFKVVRMFRDRSYDVVHIHEPLQPSLNYYAMWSAGTAARICTFHSYMEHESRRMLWARRFWSMIAFPSYDRAIAVSPAAAVCAHNAKRFEKPMAIIPNGIRNELYAHAGDARVRGPGEPLRMLFVGHWRDSRKGLPYLLDACARLTERGVRWTLDVVGGGGDIARSELPGVTYHGPISAEERVAELYAVCDVFVAPSTGMESFGIVLLEAMASGRAVVCSDIEGYRYAVGDSPGVKLVPPGGVGELTAALAELAADPAACARLGALNRARAREFDWDQLALHVRAEYLAAIETRHGAGAAADHALATVEPRARATV